MCDIGEKAHAPSHCSKLNVKNQGRWEAELGDGGKTRRGKRGEETKSIKERGLDE